MRRAMGLLLVVLLVGVGVGDGEDEVPSAMTGGFAYSSSVTIQNTSSTEANVRITYPTPCDLLTPDYEVSVAPGTRATVNVNDVVPGPWNVSAVITSDAPIVATRSMIWSDPRGCTQQAASSIGVTEPSTTWYLAEGSTYDGFETYVLVQNPGGEPAQVQVSYLTGAGEEHGPTFTLAPFDRQEINVADTLPDWSSVSVNVTSDVPVVAEQSTYWNTGQSVYSSMGVSDPSTTWYLAEGSTSGGFDTWLLVQNPGETAAQVNVTYMTSSGDVQGPGLDVGPMSREKINVADTLPDHPHFSLVVTSDVPVIAERSMYWDDGHGVNTAMGVTAPSREWYFAEGSPSGSFSTWLVVQNVGSDSAQVMVDFVFDSGAQAGPSLDLDPFARQSISVSEFVGDPSDTSIVVTSTGPILAERGMYWQCGDDVHRDLQFGVTLPSVEWHLPSTPYEPLLTIPADSSPADRQVPSDRDGDGVPDEIDLCPDYPGDPTMNGC